MSGRTALLALLLGCMAWNPADAAPPTPREPGTVEHATAELAPAVGW